MKCKQNVELSNHCKMDNNSIRTPDSDNDDDFRWP